MGKAVLALENKLKPNKRGNLVERAAFYWITASVEFKKEGWKARELYEHFKREEEFKSMINSNFKWKKIH